LQHQCERRPRRSLLGIEEIFRYLLHRQLCAGISQHLGSDGLALGVRREYLRIRGRGRDDYHVAPDGIRSEKTVQARYRRGAVKARIGETQGAERWLLISKTR